MDTDGQGRAAGAVAVRAWLKTAAWGALAAFAAPQLFVFSYFFPLLVKGADRAGLVKALALLGLEVTWVSLPFFALAVLLYKALLARQVRGAVVFALCAAAGCLWLTVWNHWVYDLFSYGRAALPVLLCSLATAGYALARGLYFKGLPPPPEKAGRAGGSLPE